MLTGWLSSLQLRFQRGRRTVTRRTWRPRRQCAIARSSRAEALEVRILPAAISYGTAGANYTQNFDNLYTTVPNNNTTQAATVLPAGWEFVEAGANANATLRNDNGSSGTGDTYLYGATSSNERAFGSYASGSLTSIFGASFVNNTGTTLTSFTLQYTGEQWKDGGNASAVLNTLAFSYAIGTSGTITLTAGATYTNETNLNFTAPKNNTSADATLDGNASGNRALVGGASGFTVSGLNWGAGQVLYIRWSDINDAGNDDGLAVDDLTFSASAGAVNSAPVLGGTNNPASFTPGGSAIPVNPNITVSDSDSPTLASGTVSITSGFQSGQDVLGFTNDNSTTYGNIQGSYSAGTGVLTLTSSGSTATVAQWQAALRAVAFSGATTAGARTVSFSVNDGSGTATATSNTLQTTVNVIGNAPPTFTSSPTFSVPENTTAVGTVTATDPESATLTYSIVGGADQLLFSINQSTGALSFASAPNFEAPADAGLDNVYNVTVQVTDGANPVTQAIAVTVTNVNDIAPTISVNRTIVVRAGQTVQLSAALLAATDADSGPTSLAYTVTTPPAGALKKNNVAVSSFTQTDLNASDTTANAIRYTAGSSNDSFVVSLTDGTFTVANITVNVTIAADATQVSFTGPNYTQSFDNLLTTPIIDGRSVPQASVLPQGWVVVETGFGAGNDNTDSSIGVDNGAGGTGDSYLYGTNGSNERALGSYASGSSVSVFGLMIKNTTGATIDNFSLAYIGEQWKNGISGTAVLNTLTFDYKFEAASFTDTGFTPVTSLNFTAPQGGTVGSDTALDGNNVSNRTSVSASVTGISWAPNQVLFLRWSDVNDAGNDDGLAVDDLTFSSTASNQPPAFTSGTSFNVPENTTAVTTVTATDPENATLTYSVIGGLDQLKFSIDQSSGALSFVSAPNFESPTDSNADNIYNVIVQVSDGVNLVTQTINVTVTDVDEIAPTASFVTVSSPRTTAVGTVTINFSEAVSGVDITDFSLTRNGAAVSLSGLSVTQATTSQYTIDLSSVTASGGDYVLTLNPSGAGITDGAGNALATGATLSWTNLQVSGFVVQNGQAQRSFVNRLEVTLVGSFEMTNFTSSSFKLTRYDLNGLNGGNVSYGSVSKSGNKLVFDFGPLGIGGNRTSTTGDGYYSLELNLDGDATFETSKSFYRLMGDVNGDRKVDSTDMSLVQAQIGQPYNSLFDLDGNGVVDTRDRGMVQRSLNRQILNSLVLDG